MTKGEEQLRARFEAQIGVDDLADLRGDPWDLIDGLIAEVKSGEYLVHLGDICLVDSTEWMAYQDGYITRAVDYEDPDPEENE